MTDTCRGCHPIPQDTYYGLKWPHTCDAIVKHCALCAQDAPHAVVRRSVDGRGRAFIVTEGQCGDCTVRMDESRKKLSRKLGQA